MGERVLRRDDLLQPEPLDALVKGLAKEGLDLTRADVAALLSDVLEALPAPEVLEERRRRALLSEVAAWEESLGSQSWRPRTLRLALTLLQVYEEWGVDSTPILLGALDGAEEAGASPAALQAIIRAAWNSSSSLAEVEASPQEFLERAREELYEPTELVPTWKANWEALHRHLAPRLLVDLLHPVDLSTEEWAQWLFEDEEALLVRQRETLEQLLPGDLERAGVQETPEGFTGLPTPWRE